MLGMGSDDADEAEMAKRVDRAKIYNDIHEYIHNVGDETAEGMLRTSPGGLLHDASVAKLSAGETIADAPNAKMKRAISKVAIANAFRAKSSASLDLEDEEKQENGDSRPGLTKTLSHTPAALQEMHVANRELRKSVSRRGSANGSSAFKLPGTGVRVSQQNLMGAEALQQTEAQQQESDQSQDRQKLKREPSEVGNDDDDDDDTDCEPNRMRFVRSRARTTEEKKDNNGPGSPLDTDDKRSTSFFSSTGW